MPQCRVCHKELTNPARPCPGCGFQEPAFFGDRTSAEQLISRKADAYRTQYLSEFDFGVTIYRWKDEDGSLVLDHTERMSFGSGSALLDKTCWLEQPFARIPDTQQLQLQLAILRNGQDYRQITISVPVPRGNHLLSAGISLSRDMKVRLLLKNPQEQTQSTPVAFLLD